MRLTRRQDRFFDDDDIEREKPEPRPEPPEAEQTEPWGSLDDAPRRVHRWARERLRDGD